MIIMSREVSYEVIQVLSESAGLIHYLCRKTGDQTKIPWHLLCISREGLGTEGIPYILELEENPGFTDLEEYFLWEEFIILVFPYPAGRPFLEALEPLDMKGRFAVGQSILERFLLLMMPVYIRWEVSAADCIYLDEGCQVQFFYPMSQVSSYSCVNEIDAWKRLAILFRSLFQKKEWEGLYPEVEEFLNEAEKGEWGELIDGYQAYLQLLPVCSENRQEEKQQKKPLLPRIKKAGMKALGVLKVAMGLGVLAAAAVMLPQAWREHVTPYLEAASLWKSIYVDGETQEQESETATESETDQDNGFVTRYWDNGRIHYQGDMLNGIYEGKGTLYYPNGGMEYQGEFAFGKKEGAGCLYTEEGILVYEGGFHRERYDGEGKLYDVSLGTLMFEGGFSDGRYDGEGILFNPITDYPVYKGAFRLGYYDGEGVEYDSNGSLLYEGDFLLGVYHGTGVYYDASTGLVMLEGEFRNGSLVSVNSEDDVPEREESPEGEAPAEESPEAGAEPKELPGAEPKELPGAETAPEEASGGETAPEEASGGETADAAAAEAEAAQEGAYGDERTENPLGVLEKG